MHFHLDGRSVTTNMERGGMRRYIVSHLPHKLGGNLMKNILQIHHLVWLGRLELLDALRQILRESHIGQDPQVGRVEKAQAGFALEFPKVTVRIDDAIPEKVPGAGFDKVAFGEETFVLEDVVEVFGIVDEHARGEGWDCEGEGLVAELALAFVEPAEEVPARLEELYAVAHEGEGVGWVS